MPAKRKPASQLSQSHDLESLIGYNLKRAYITVRDDFAKALGPDGLAPREFSLLSLVVTFPNITQSELARMLGIERSGLVAIVDKLERINLLKRIPVPGDKRAQALVASKDGLAAYQDMRQQVITHEANLMSHFTDDERQELVRLLNKIRLKDDS